VRVRVLFFGQLRDLTGAGSDTLELPDGAVLEQVFDHYAGRFPALRAMRSSIVLARNHEFASAAAALAEDDEIALLPPVSGGTGPWTHEITLQPAGHFFALTRQPIDVPAIEKRLIEGHDGAIVTFQGVVRNNTKGRLTRYLEYECYEDMAINLMTQIGGEIAQSLAVSRIAMVHRLGRLDIGEASVVVASTAPHRKPAFEAALEGINRLKKLVPIWKKEFFADGEAWVEGEWDNSVLRR
jgi:molybdopterin synthase catalytic subunit